jgi:hypothetical protein
VELQIEWLKILIAKESGELIPDKRLIPGTECRTVVRTGLPSTGFRDANEGVEASKSTFENRLCKAYILAGRVECDQAMPMPKSMAHLPIRRWRPSA